MVTCLANRMPGTLLGAKISDFLGDRNLYMFYSYS